MKFPTAIRILRAAKKVVKAVDGNPYTVAAGRSAGFIPYGDGSGDGIQVIVQAFEYSQELEMACPETGGLLASLQN